MIFPMNNSLWLMSKKMKLILIPKNIQDLFLCQLLKKILDFIVLNPLKGGLKNFLSDGHCY